MCYIRGLDTSGVPIGTIQDFGQAALPFGFVACVDGIPGKVLRLGTYAKLFAAIGTTYNTGGELGTEFRLPGAPGRTRVMPGSYTDPVTGVIARAAGQRLGAEAHVNTIAQTPLHGHPGTTVSIAGGAFAAGGGAVGGFANGGTNLNQITGIINMSAEGGGASHNNMQPSLVIGNVGIAYI